MTIQALVLLRFLELVVPLPIGSIRRSQKENSGLDARLWDRRIPFSKTVHSNICTLCSLRWAFGSTVICVRTDTEHVP
jgi:hypothetical protein